MSNAVAADMVPQIPQIESTLSIMASTRSSGRDQHVDEVIAVNKRESVKGTGNTCDLDLNLPQITWPSAIRHTLCPNTIPITA
jgi:hypothetical protein